MEFEAEWKRTDQHKRYLENVETDILAWMQAEDIEDAALLRMAVKVADASAVMPGMDDATVEEMIERASVILADRKAKKVISDEIPPYPELTAAVESEPRPAAARLRPGDAPPGGGEGVGGGRPVDSEAAAAGGDGQGQAAQEGGRPGNVTPAVDQTAAGAQLVLPGAEQITDAEYAQNLANKPAAQA